MKSYSKQTLIVSTNHIIDFEVEQIETHIMAIKLLIIHTISASFSEPEITFVLKKIFFRMALEKITKTHNCFS